MRLTFASAAFLLLTAITLPRVASASPADLVPDAAGLSQLEQRAEHADPRERCFLYTQLTHFYVEIAGKEIAAGDMDEATSTFKRIERYAQIIHSGLTTDPRHHKKLKDAEMVMERTSHRLAEYLHLVSSDDKEALQATLKQIDKVNQELLAQVFAH